MKTIRFSVVALFTMLVFPLFMNAQQPVPTEAAAAVVPRLVNFSGTAVNAQGKPLSGITGITFSLYKGPKDKRSLPTSPFSETIANLRVSGSAAFIIS